MKIIGNIYYYELCTYHIQKSLKIENYVPFLIDSCKHTQDVPLGSCHILTCMTPAEYIKMADVPFNDVAVVSCSSGGTNP